MVPRTTFVVLCIVAGLTLFSEGFDQQGWMWASLVGLVVAGAVLMVEYSLQKAKPGALLGGISGLAVGLVLAGIAAWAMAGTPPAVELLPILGFLLLAAFPYL